MTKLTLKTSFAVLFAILIASGCNSAPSALESAQQQGKVLDANMRQSFEHMLEVSKDQPSLHRRIEDLRNEWEVGKDDPQKLDVVKQKMADLKADIKNGKY